MNALDVLQSVVWWVGRTSIEASVVACLVLVTQLVFRRQLNAKWKHALWMLVVVRLVMPFSPQSPASVFNVANVDRAAARVTPTKTDPPSAASSLAFQVPSLRPVNQAVTVSEPIPVQSSAHSVPWQPILVLTWLAVTLLFAGRLLIGQHRLSKRVRQGRIVTDPSILELLGNCKKLIGVRASIHLIASTAVQTPALMGVFRPKLLLPPHVIETFVPAKLRDIFLHELAHLKRGDVVINWVASVLQVVHWFNPVLWYAFSRIRIEREMACDSFALSVIPAGDNQHYGNTIIDLMEHASHSGIVPSVVGIVEEKSEMQRRIAMIAEFRKNKHEWAILAGILCLALGVVSLTSAQSGNAPSPTTIDEAGHTSLSPLPSNESTNTWGQILYTHYMESDVYDAPMSSTVLWTLGANEAVKVDFKAEKWCAVFKPSEQVRCITNALGYMQLSDLFTNPLPVGPIEGGIGSAPPVAISVEEAQTLPQIRAAALNESATLKQEKTEDEKAEEQRLKTHEKNLRMHGLSPAQWSEMEELYGANSKLTDLQKSELWRRYEGRRIEWTGEFCRVADDESLCIRMSQGTQSFDVNLKLVLTTAAQKRVKQLTSGEMIVFRGTFLSLDTWTPIRLGYGDIVNGRPLDVK